MSPNRKMTQKKMWKLLMRAWEQGPACKLEVAARYTRQFRRDASGWMVLADGLAGMARYREAEVAMREADRLIAPKHRWFVATQWGHLYREKEDLARAERWYRKALVAHPGVGTHIFVGAILAKRGCFTEAKKHHSRAIRLAEGLQHGRADEAYFNLGLILRAEEKHREAASAFRKAIRLDPRYAIAREALNDVKQALLYRKRFDAVGKRQR